MLMPYSEFTPSTIANIELKASNLLIIYID